MHLSSSLRFANTSLRSDESKKTLLCVKSQQEINHLSVVDCGAGDDDDDDEGDDAATNLQIARCKFVS